MKFIEGITVPETAFKVVLKTAGIEFDVTEQKKTEPNIEDSADYRENITYLNEVSFKLDNTDGHISQILASTEEVECFIYAYINNAEGKNYPLKIYGGTVSKERSKENNILKEYELLIIPYFGKSDRTALRLNTQYLDEHGLKLFNTELWITDAAIEGFVLSAGTHTIHAKTDGGYFYAKLNNGEWTSLGSGAEWVLESEEDSYGATMKCKVYFYAFSWSDSAERKSTIIVKNEGDKYPYTYFYYPLVREVVEKAFREMDLSDFKIDRFLIETFDGRRVISGTSRIDNDQANAFIPVAMVSDGASRIFISGSTAAGVFPYKNQIWEYNHVTGAVTLLYETTLNNNTHFKLVWDTDEKCLFAFIENKETDEDRGFLQKFIFSEFGFSYGVILYNDPQFETVNPYYRFHYSQYLKLFVYMAMNGGQKKIFTVDINGNRTEVLTDNAMEINGFSFLYDDGEGNVFYYFLKNSHGGIKKLYRLQYVAEWIGPEEVNDWFDAVNYNNFTGTQYLYENKILVVNYDRTEARFLDLETNIFSSNLCPGSTAIYSPIEIFDKLYFIKRNTATGEEKISYFRSDEITDESRKISPYDLTSNAGIYGFQQLTEYTDINDVNVIGALSKNPALLLKFADNIEPFIEGELDTSGQTIRDVLQDIANNFLAWIKVDYNKKGWFVKRAGYNSGSTLTLKKEYTAGRLKDTVYNEKYDAVEIENKNGFVKIFGDTGIDAKRLSLKLDFIPDDFVMDAAKYFFNYYSTERKKYAISYLPGYFNCESLDRADMSDYGLGTGIIHKVKPGKVRVEFEVLIDG